MHPIDFSKYSYTRLIPEWCIDERHVNILFHILMRCDFQKVLEVGSLDGASAVAYIEALQQNKTFQLHLCDVEIRPSLLRLVKECPHGDRIFVSQAYSWEAINPSFDFVFVDADHQMEATGRDINRLLECDIPTVAAHDVNSAENGYGGCEGTQLLGRVFSRLRGFEHSVDCALRSGEFTQRGLMVATRDARVHQVASEVFSYWS